MPLRAFIKTWFLYTVTIWSIINDLISGFFIWNQLWCFGWLYNSSLFTDLLGSILHSIPVVNILFLAPNPMFMFIVASFPDLINFIIS